MSSSTTYSVIGCGEFGSVAAKYLAPLNSEVLVFDKDAAAKTPQNARRVGYTAAIGADIIILAVPYDAYDSVLPVLAQNSPTDSLIVDVCSVKMKPTESFQEHGLLERPNVLMTHPLFGPQSTVDGVEGKNIVITQQAGNLAETLLDSWRQKGINFKPLSAEGHDREIAKVHALTFFVGRALLEMGVEPSPLNTPYYSELLDLVEVEHHHSPELFYTIQRHNPFAREVREAFMAKLRELEARIDQPYPN